MSRKYCLTSVLVLAMNSFRLNNTVSQLQSMANCWDDKISHQIKVYEEKLFNFQYCDSTRWNSE